MNLKLMDEPGVRNCYADEQPVRDQFWHPGPGEVVIDAGSALGSYSMPALMAGAQVIAIEPDGEARKRFATIAEMNGFTSYVQLDVALFSSSAGYPQAMRAELEDSEYYYLIPPRDTPFATLDQVAVEQGLSRADWIKIDVEGAEFGVIKGGLATLERWHPKLLIEDHTGIYPFVAEMRSQEKILELLDRLGYEVQITSYGPPYRDYIYAEVA